MFDVIAYARQLALSSKEKVAMGDSNPLINVAEQIARLKVEREEFIICRMNPFHTQQARAAGRDWALQTTWEEIQTALTVGPAYFIGKTEGWELLTFIRGVQDISSAVSDTR